MSGLPFNQTFDSVLSGAKTETRRLHWPSRLAPAKTRAIIPGRCQPAPWFGWNVDRVIRINDPAQWVSAVTGATRISQAAAQAYLLNRGFVQARIEIEAVWYEPLHHMTEADALCEGVASVYEYAHLWNSINHTPGTTWSDNPHVCVIQFHRTFDLYAMLRRMDGRKVA